MRRALEGHHRSVYEDGSPESDYAVGLALAIVSWGTARASTRTRRVWV